MPNIYTNQLLVYVNGRTQKISADDTLVIGGPFTAASFSGDGSALTALDATNITTGTLADARLSANVALYDAAAPTFTNTVSAAGFSGSGASLTSLDASNVSSGTLADGRLSANVPLLNAASNVFTGSITASSFNGPLGGDGSAITNLNASALASGTVPDARLSANVALLDAASNTFTGSITASSVSADGSGLTNLDGSAIASGTVADGRLSGNVALYDAAAPTFTNTVSAAGFSGSGASLTSLNASELSSGTVADARLSGNVAKYDDATPTFTNTVAAAGFSGDGSALTSLNGSNISSGTVADARLTANVPLKNAATNVFTGDLEANAISAGNGFYGNGSSITNINATNIDSGELSDARLSSNIPRKDAASNSFSGSMSVGGDLVVSGDIISAGAQSVIIGDNFLDLNAGNTVTATPAAGGLSVNVQAQGTAFTATEFIPGVVGVSNPTIMVSADPTADFVQGDLIQVSGSTDSKNDGQYVVQAVAVNNIEVKGIGVDAVPGYVPFAHNQFVTQNSQTATVTKANFSVFAVSNGDLFSASGAIPTGKWAQAYGSTESAFDQTWIPADPNAAVTLQSAYNNGAAIEMTAAVGAFTVEPAAGETASFSFTGNSGSTVQTNDADLFLKANGTGRLRLYSGTMVSVETVATFENLTLTYGPNSLAQWSVAAYDNTGALVLADADTADVEPVGVVYNSSSVASIAGNFVNVLGEAGTSWSAGAAIYLSGEAGTATNVPPSSGRVYKLGVALDVFDASVDAYAQIRWNPQYVCDL